MKVKLPGFNRFILLCLIMVSAQMVSVAQTIKGSITDAKSGETLIGATVHIEKDNFKQNTGVKLDGTYLFKNIPAGTYTLQASYVGYKTSKQYTLEVKSANSEAILNIALTNNANTLGEVAITGHMNKASEGAARSVEKNAGVTLNAVSAQAIALSPDVLVSNVLSRVSGISISRGNTGDARHVIIRGMDKQYNTTLINGIKIPSPDNKNRYVPLDIFPAELVDRLDVYKTLTPDMEADASGGVVNLVMKTAPDRLKIEGNFGTGYSKIFMDRKYESFDRSTVNSKSPGELAPGTAASISQFPYQNLLTSKKVAPPNMNASLTIGDRFLNNKLGVLFSGSYQNSYQGNNSFVVVQENTVGPSPDINTPNQETAFQSSYKRQYSANVKRIGTMAALDYKIDNANTLKFFATYLQLDEYSVRQTESSSYGGYSYQGYRGTYSIDNFTQTRSDLQSIYNFTLSGKHYISKKFSIDWTGASSQASHKLPDIAEFHTDYGTNPSATTNQPTGNPSEPYTSVASAIDKSPVQVANESRQWQRNTDKDLSGYFNLHYNSDNIFGRRAEFSAGGMYRHKTRDNYSNAYSLPNTYIAGTGNPELYTSIPEATFSFAPYPDNAYGSYRSSAGVYSFTENVQGGYGMVKYALSKKLDAIFGLRVEKTDQNYYSNLPVTFPGKTGAISYSDYLPSVNIKYAIDEEQAIRASYFKSILRPAFADLIPYPDGTTDDPYQHTGNPYLQHTVIDNYDLRYEFFPGVFDEFMVGAYFKNLDNPIETVLLPGGSGATLYLQPQNLGRARNYGAELVAKKFWGDIGASINYTYTQSRITTLKSINVNGNVTTRLQTRPLQGQAAHIGNASILYKNQKYGIDAQLSLSYNGERIQAVSNYYGLDTWERPSTYLDFSAQKKIGKHFIIYVKANDLLNTPYQLIIKQDNKYNYSGILKYANQKSPNYTTVQYDQFYARYSLGAKYNF